MNITLFMCYSSVAIRADTFCADVCGFVIVIKDMRLQQVQVKQVQICAKSPEEACLKPFLDGSLQTLKQMMTLELDNLRNYI